MEAQGEMSDPDLMKTRVFAALYWLMGLMIGLGAFGHGFGGVKPVRAALATSPSRTIFVM